MACCLERTHSWRHLTNKLHLLARSRMGGSLRRHKKHKPKIIKRQKKKRFTKSEVPQELVVNAQEIKEKLGVE